MPSEVVVSGEVARSASGKAMGASGALQVLRQLAPGQAMIPEVLVGDGLRLARKYARTCSAQVHKETGCHMVAIVAEIPEPGRACTSMAVDPSLEDRPDVEVALMKCAMSRVMSLLVLHLGVREAMACAITAMTQAAELARLAEDDAASG